MVLVRVRRHRTAAGAFGSYLRLPPGFLAGLETPASLWLGIPEEGRTLVVLLSPTPRPPVRRIDGARVRWVGTARAYRQGSSLELYLAKQLSFDFPLALGTVYADVQRDLLLIPRV